MIGTATSVINWKYLPGTTSIVAGAFAWVCYHCQQVNGMWMNQCSACYVYKTSAAPCSVNHAEVEDAAENAIIVESGIIQTAIAEIENGGGVHFKTVDEMMKWLDEE